MSDAVREALIRSAILMITIVGAVFVFFVVRNLRDGTFQLIPTITAILVVIALIWLNRWWYQRTGTRI